MAKEAKTKKEADAPANTVTGKTKEPTKAVPSTTSKAPPALEDINVLAAEMGLKDWEKAALFKAAGWAAGKQVTNPAFVEKVELFRARQMGAGRI